MTFYATPEYDYCHVFALVCAFFLSEIENETKIKEENDGREGREKQKQKERSGKKARGEGEMKLKEGRAKKRTGDGVGPTSKRVVYMS